MEVDLRDRSVRPLLQSPHLISVGIVSVPKPLPDGEGSVAGDAKTVSRVALRASDRLFVLDPATGDKREFQLPERFERGTTSTFTRLDGNNCLLNWVPRKWRATTGSSAWHGLMRTEPSDAKRPSSWRSIAESRRTTDHLGRTGGRFHADPGRLGGGSKRGRASLRLCRTIEQPTYTAAFVYYSGYDLASVVDCYGDRDFVCLAGLAVATSLRAFGDGGLDGVCIAAGFPGLGGVLAGTPADETGTLRRVRCDSAAGSGCVRGLHEALRRPAAGGDGNLCLRPVEPFQVSEGMPPDVDSARP